MGHVGDWVEVTTAREMIHAHLIKGMLAEEGIEARIGNEFLQGALGDIPLGYSSAPKILVHARSLERAREIVAELEAGGMSTVDE